MPLIQRAELQSFINDSDKLAATQLYLFFGERFLCRESVDALQNQLLKLGNGAVHAIDGDQEDSGQTLSKLMSFSLLPGNQIYRVTDSRIFHSKTVAASIWQKAQDNHQVNKEKAAMRHLLAFAQLASIETSAQHPFSEISGDEWTSLFGFSKPATTVEWADDLFVKAVGTGNLPKKSGANLADRYIESFSGTIPQQNFLILTAETVDKRQRLFTFIKKNGLAIDCSVASGAGSVAQKEQKEVLHEMVKNSLAGFNKSIDPKGLELLFDRVGFHPVAVVMETEKLALYVEDRATITRQDIEEMVGRNREDALFELTDAFGKHQVPRTLHILNRLQENGTHGLAILATMRNYLRKLLIFRSLQLQQDPPYQKGMTAKLFQSQYLPQLKERGEWNELLGGHPYGLFMSFSKASEFSCKQLQKYLKLLLKAEYRFKGSPISSNIILEELFLAMFKDKKASHKK